MKFIFILLSVLIVTSQAIGQSPELGSKRTFEAEQKKSEVTVQKKKLNKYKDQSEIGIHFGNMTISGDVNKNIISGFGTGIYYRKALNYAFSIRGELLYGKTSGLNSTPSDYNLLQEQNIFAGYGPENPWFFAYQTTYMNANIQGVLELSNISATGRLKHWNYYIFAGIGFDSHSTMLDLKDENGQVYQNLIETTEWNTTNDYNTINGRRNIRNILKSTYDGVYETPGFKKEGAFRLGDETNIHMNATLGAGISRKFGRKFSLGLEHQFFISDNDYLDGQRWRTEVDQTNNIDIVHYTSLKLGFNIGNKMDRKIPLYWQNPWDEVENHVGEIDHKLEDIEERIKDGDLDGVIDSYDLEKNTAFGCPVNHRGIAKDSDKDGIIDCKDLQPYLNKDQLKSIVEDLLPKRSEAQQLGLSESEVIALIQKYIPEEKPVNPIYNYDHLPMIHFENNSIKLDKDNYLKLAEIAVHLKNDPQLCLTVIGHTDEKADIKYNETLSFNRSQNIIQTLTEHYGFSRSRFKLMYKGEHELLIKKALGARDQMVNRRVEFKVCNATHYDMSPN